MPNQFEITQVINRGTRKGCAQIVVNFQGRSVTRHIRDGVGRHPDNLIPTLHKKLADRIQDAERMKNDKMSAIGLLEQKKPKDWEALVLRMQDEIRTLNDSLTNGLKPALAVLQKEDPIMVKYV